MRILIRALVVVVVLVVLVAVGVVLGAGSLVRRAVEREGTASLRLRTTLDRATVSLFGGKLGLHGLAIASPQGFSAPHLLELGDLDVAVRYGELRQKPIHVDSIDVQRPTLVVEQSGGALNFRKAMEQIPASPPGKKPMKLVIDRFVLANGRVLIRPGLPGIARELEVSVPTMTLRDIGRGKGAQNGAALKDVAFHVITALASAAAQSKSVPPEVRALLQLNAAQVVGQLGAEAQKRIAAAVPGPLGKALSGASPDSLEKGASSVLQDLQGKPQGRTKPRSGARR